MTDLSYDEAHGVSEKIHGEHPHGKAFDGNMNPYEAHKSEDDDAASVGTDDEALHTLPVADEHGQPAHYPGEEEHKRPAKDLDEEAKKDAPRSVIAAGIESFKYLYSSILLIFSVILVMAAIFSEQTVGTADKGVHPILAFFIFWALILWLAMMEGGQGCLVGLQPIEKALYADSHPKTLKNTSIAHKGDNMERFIVGRQFLVVLVVFVSNLMSSSVSDVDVLGLPDSIQSVFMTSGVALILVTIMLCLLYTSPSPRD